MINTLFKAMQLSKLLLFLSFRTRKHTSIASRANLSNFFEEHSTQNHPQCLSGSSRALFPITFLEIALGISVSIHLIVITDYREVPCKEVLIFYINTCKEVMICFTAFSAWVDFF